MHNVGTLGKHCSQRNADVAIIVNLAEFGLENILDPGVKMYFEKVQQKGRLPLARSSHSITVIKNKAYLFGGEHKPRYCESRKSDQMPACPP